MKIFLPLLYLVLCFFNSLFADNETLWVNTLGSHDDDDVKVTTCTDDGIIFYAGNFEGQFDEFAHPIINGVYIRKVSSQGDTEWTITLPPDYNAAFPTAIDYDEFNETLYIIVHYIGYSDYITDVHFPSRSVVYSFDNSGNQINSTEFEGCLLTDIKIKSPSSFILCGAAGSDKIVGDPWYFSFQDNPIFITLPNAEDGFQITGNPAAFIAEYDFSGNINWSYFIDADEMSYVPIEVAISNWGDIFLLGNRMDQDNLRNWNSMGEIYPFLVKFDASGNVYWQIEDSLLPSQDSRDIVSGIALDDDGDIYICGVEGATTDSNISSVIYSGPIHSILSIKNGARLFTAKLANNNGNLIWKYNASSNTESAGVYDIAVDAYGVNVVGEFWGSISFSQNSEHKFFGNRDALLLRLTHAGDFRAAFAFGSQGHERAQCFHLNGNNLVIGGFFETTFDINPFGNKFVNVSSTGQKDAFIASYDFTSPDFILHTLFHPADVNEDNNIVIDEITSYGRAVINNEEWSSLPKNMETLLKGVFLWKNGEKYKKSGNNLPNDWIIDDESSP